MMQLKLQFIAKVHLLNTQVPAFQQAYNAGSPVCRNMWHEAMHTQNQAADLGNLLLGNGVDLPMGAVYQLLTHTDVIMAFSPLLG
jgi:hypothetical protein